MTIPVVSPRDIQTSLNYLALFDDQPLYNYVDIPSPHVQKCNYGRDPHSVIVHDVRGKGNAFNLDVCEFQFVHYPSVEKEFVDENKITSTYYAEVEEILKKYAGAKRVFIFDHTIRRQESSKASQRPVKRVHVDQTFASAIQRVEYHLPDEAERLLKGRFRIINVWRPIANIVAHEPLAAADYRSIDTEHDLVSTRFIFSDREGAAFNVKYNPAHKWYYLSDQTPDEVALIKCFDSDTDKARLTPHSAFEDSTSMPDAPQRQSIEVRALVFDTE